MSGFFTLTQRIRGSSATARSSSIWIRSGTPHRARLLLKLNRLVAAQFWAAQSWEKTQMNRTWTALRACVALTLVGGAASAFADTNLLTNGIFELGTFTNSGG